jgi:hypothetical protein
LSFGGYRARLEDEGIIGVLGQASAKADAYNTTMYIMAGLFVAGLICNFSSRQPIRAST